MTFMQDLQFMYIILWAAPLFLIWSTEAIMTFSFCLVKSRSHRDRFAVDRGKQISCIDTGY